ncbi:MAG TPA: glycosyltransferase [Candidatus Saccharimonadales bacterium]|nr:glycosyltransferase [Candidatus Saccharimonadales bacterium]
MPFVSLAVFGLFLVCQAGLMAVGGHRLALLWRCRRGAGPRGRRPGRPAAPGLLPAQPSGAGFGPPEPPAVTVQLPLHNERYVVRRLIQAVAALDYPRERLEIQVLDDSTDDTTAAAEACAAQLRARGHRVEVLHRAGRAGFKAGALAAGLARARGELLAVFDADFVPPADFLRRVLPHFSDPRVGMVQARWGHLNEPYSLLTRVQAAFLDSHFLVEHRARSRAGLFFNFNGTAGVWRRAAVVDAGGWRPDTLTEDLDLSYRAQLRGWRFVYLEDLVVPAELPVEMNAFKSQQYRWARGSLQTARRLLPAVLRARLPLRVRLEACFHLAGNLAYPLALLPAVLMLPLMRLPGRHLGPPAAPAAAVFALTTAAFVAFFAAALGARGARGWRRWAGLPAMLIAGIGLSLNNTRAALAGLAGPAGPRVEFRRTPKFRVEGREGGQLGRRYRAAADPWALLELALAGYFAASAGEAVRLGRYEAVPFLLLFTLGFGYVGGGSLLEQLRLPGRPGEVGRRLPSPAPQA